MGWGRSMICISQMFLHIFFCNGTNIICHSGCVFFLKFGKIEGGLVFAAVVVNCKSLGCVGDGKGSSGYNGFTSDHYGEKKNNNHILYHEM